jgi:hypothetical protein
VALLAATVALAGCTPEPEPPDSSPPPDATTAADSVEAAAPPANPFAEPARRALRIELRLDAYRAIAGAWAGGDASSEFMAYFDGDTLRLIEEALDFGEYGAAHATYYFDGGALFYVVEDETRARLTPGAPGADTLRTRVAFGPDGAIEQSEQVENGVVVPLPEVEAEGFRRHVDALREQLRAAAPPA